jgi:AcrR family transcriptional regulator
MATVSAARSRDPAPEQGTRDRLVTAGAEQFRRNGYAGTGIKAILTAGRAPSGSLYHFFPGGKEELGVASLRAGGDTYRELVELFFADADAGDPVAATRAFFDGAADFVASTDFADACPVASVAMEIANTSEPMRQAAADAFESWLAVLRDRLGSAGLCEADAATLAVELFCAIEGAFLLARVTRDVEPIRIAGRAAAARVADALASATSTKKTTKTTARRR